MYDILPSLSTPYQESGNNYKNST